MTVAGVKTTRSQPHGRPRRPGGRWAKPVVVARVTLAAPPAPPRPADPVDPPVSASRHDLHVARRVRRRDAMLGLGVLAATLGATVAVLDMLH
ncbi:MAG TPA: hypothetical protein VN793_06425 [Acidimicrobiales bacterium]|nr:hypothetical protein [Acidimicrobiales bacterium]